MLFAVLANISASVEACQTKVAALANETCSLTGIICQYGKQQLLYSRVHLPYWQICRKVCANSTCALPIGLSFDQAMGRLREDFSTFAV